MTETTAGCSCSHCISDAEHTSQAARATILTQAFSSGTARTDAVLDDSTWTGTIGQPANISYGFAANFDAAAQNAARTAMQDWSNVANVSFFAQPFNPGITYSKTTFSDPTQGGVTNTTFVGQTIKNVNVQISTSETTLTRGTFGYMIMLHEIGHALGLKHTGNYGSGDEAPFLSNEEDNFRASVMSYNPETIVNYTNPPTTPMLYDIAAIQYLYGANTSYQAGDTFYDLSSAKNAQALWDGGGSDMFSAATYSGQEGVTINLNAGLEHYSKVGGNYLWVAFNANIEHAQGSSFNDAVTGNGLANMLYGRGGSDIVTGNEGADTLFGGVGAADTTDAADTLYGGTDGDQLYGNSGNDVIYGGRGIFDPEDGNDAVYGGKGFDSVYGNAGNDTLYGGGTGVDPLDEADLIYGGKGADVIYGNGSNDTLYGGGSSFDPEDAGDAIYGGVGNDLIFGNGGVDSIYGGTGNDTMHGGVGNDLYYFDLFSDGSDQILLFEGAGIVGGDQIMIASGLPGSGITNVADALARTNYDGANAYINFGNGNGVLVLGIGVVAFTADDIGIF